jgi:hypothetical protein
MSYSHTLTPLRYGDTRCDIHLSPEIGENLANFGSRANTEVRLGNNRVIGGMERDDV